MRRAPEYQIGSYPLILAHFKFDPGWCTGAPTSTFVFLSAPRYKKEI